MTAEKSFNFEKAYERLEDILEKMGKGDIALDESLKLYEEADKLITDCSKKLADAEKRVEMLIKKRNGEIEMNPDGSAQTEDFN
ncbi:MAG: exodeoxyribonuclease VII small subunit [Chlamydiia bacterium]|nr:exodeoxyribonuclease VII small subunit [Chlamydiia bacterium]